MIWCGVDLGKSGGIVMIDDSGEVLYNTIMPVTKHKNGKNDYDIHRILGVFKTVRPDYVCIEQPIMHPMSGKISQTSTHMCFGGFRFLLTALNIPYNSVQPYQWQRKILKLEKGADTKAASIAFVRKAQPAINWKKSDRAEKFHDGMTDAYCIALYGSRHIFKEVGVYKR